MKGIGMAIEQASKSQVVSALQSARGKLSKIREKTRETTRRGVGAAVGVAGGYGAGYLAANHAGSYYVPKTSLPVPVAVGGAALLAGLMELGGDQSDHVLMLGVGMLSGHAALAARGVVPPAPKK
ncbi:MAG: hypothetical protein KIT41_14270 [Pyrinomonadaceae bacterium]|nr:hypothetical protein [Pyrinomonadaceae bacterium]